MVSAADRAELDALAELDKRPTAPQRVVRSAGQGGMAYVVLDAADAFGWFGADDWNPTQAKAAMALAFAVIAAAQNLGPKVPALLGRAWTAWKQRKAT